MESHCLKCKKVTKNIEPKVSSTSYNMLIILSKCAICGNKKSKFVIQQKAGLLSKLDIK